MEEIRKESLQLDPQVSVAESLFTGTIVEENLFPFPMLPDEQAETVRIVVDSVDKFLQSRQDEFSQFDQTGELPDEFIDSLKELGLFGLVVPEEYGGIGLSNSGYSRTVQQVSQYDASTSVTIGAHSSIGMKGLLLFGNEEQKSRYLPKLASGDMIAAFCLTESGSGSDAASISTKASKNDDGSWTLSGEKIWITNGAWADFFTVFAKTDSEKGKLSAFIVERGWDGVSTGPKEDKMGLRASATTTVTFENVKVPAENLLGEEGKGFKVAMSILNNGRTGLGGGCVGGIKRCIRLASLYARDRKQFGKSIAEFSLIKEKIAGMAVDCFATESVVAMVGHYIDSGVQNYSVEAAMSKVFASEALWRASNEALQIAGGNGFMKEYPYERLVRDCRINMIFEGTNEILRLYSALTGMKDAGSYLKELSHSVGNIFNHPIKGFGVLSDYAVRRFTHVTSLGRDRIESVHPDLREEALVFEQYTLELAKSTEGVLRRYGKNIIGQQFPTKRLAEVAMDLFVGLCALSRTTALLEQNPEGERSKQAVAMTKILTQQAKRRMNQNLRRIDRNEDDLVRTLADYIVENEGYSWDTI